MASVNNHHSVGPVLYEHQPYKDEIEQAKADLFDFLISENAEAILGQSLSAFKDHLVRVRSEYTMPAQRFENVLGELFADLIDQATIDEVLDESVSQVFYADIDRAAFIDSVATDLIAYVVVQERMKPVIQELEPRLVGLAYDELLQYIRENFLQSFKTQIKSITEESSGNFDLAYHHNDLQMPSYSTVLTRIVREGVRKGTLSPKTSEIFFSKALYRKEFVRKLINDVLSS